MPAALEPRRKRRRPQGSGCIMTKPVDFDIADAVDALSDIAYQPPQGRPWNWDGSTYPWRCIRDMSWINTERLNDHSPVLSVLIRMAPNGYPNGGRLIRLLSELNNAFSIFPKHRSKSAAHRAVMAADRWRAMCKHCLMLVRVLQPPEPARAPSSARELPQAS